jgi:hypothetical protein
MCPSTAIAGPAVWNPSGTVAAYVDYIHSPEARQNGCPDAKMISFYDKQIDRRWRGSYFPFGVHVAYGGTGFLIMPDSVEVVQWLDDDTVLISARYSHMDDSSLGAAAEYKLSTNGLTEFVRVVPLNDEAAEYYSSWRDDFEEYYPEYQTWDLLDASEACEKILYELCIDGKSSVDLTQYIDRDYLSAIVEDFPEEDLSFDCSLLPVTYSCFYHAEEGIIEVGVVYTRFLFRYNPGGGVELIQYIPFNLN